jgi:CheY-like chemotaxis protein
MHKREPPTGVAIIVEDEGAIRMVLAEILFDEGYEVRAFAAVGAALHALVDILPVLVVTDLGFDSLQDGWAIVHQMRTDPRLAQVPVVICTATLQTHEKRAAAARLCAQWLAKPFTLDGLLNSVDLARRLVAPA